MIKQHRQPVKYLLVDDLAANLAALEALLKREGLELLKARSGSEALELLLVHDIALSFIDVQMPDMDGFELAELMRGAERTRRVPIIFITAGARDEQRRFHGYELGAVDFLFKPIDPHMLKSKSDVFFELAQQRQELITAADENARLLQQRTEVEQRVRESETRLRQFFETPGVGMFRARVDGPVLECNDEFLRITGRTRIEIQAGEVCDTEITPEEWKVADVAGIAQARERGWCNPYEKELLRPDGSKVWVLISFMLLEPSRNERMAVVVDITERKRAESALRDADRRKDEFLAILAHELRNPLAPIQNAVSIFNKCAALNPKFERARDMINRQLQHMVRLIDDLLDVGRITSGKFELRCQRVELATVVEQAIQTSRPYIERGGHQLMVALPSTPVYLSADPVRLAQVFSNLLNNASKYTERCGRIWLSAEVAEQHVIVRVRDSGIGISSEHLPRVFQLFSQVDSALNRSQGGLGIGLSISKSLVEMHGGAISVFSEGPGKGSEFAVRLPVLESSVMSRVDGGPLAPELKVTGLKMLVADDNSDSADSLSMLLEMADNEVCTASNGADAVQLAALQRPDVILLDIGMPEMNGFEACREIRAQPWGKGAILIALTGWGSELDRERASEAGFNAHLTKPADPESLLRLVASLRQQLDQSARTCVP